MEKMKIKIGFAPTRRNVFSVKEAQYHKNKTLQKIKGLTDAQIIDINDINSEGLLFSEDDLSAVIKKFTDAGVDGIFCPHCNFGTEDLVGKLGFALKKPMLIWGPRDDKPLNDGSRTRDSQCGLFATGKVLRRFKVPFTYLPNATADEISFIRGFKGFVSVCSTVKSFSSMRILQLAPRPSDFWTMIINEGELLEKFNVQVFPVTMEGLTRKVKTILNNETEEFEKSIAEFKSFIDCSQIDENAVKTIIALKISVIELIKESGCTAVAIQCWTDLQEALGVMPCVVSGMFCDLGIPMVCETDIHGAVSAIMLQEAAMRTTPIFFADMTIRHPDNENAELLWHCGNFPQSLARDNSDRILGRHFALPSHCAGTGNWKLKDGDITICRFDGDNGEYSLFIGEGHTCDGPSTQGTYLWLEVNDWLFWEKKLVEGSYVHHCAGIHAHVAPILYEACKYIPYLKPDPADPSADAILQWWLGR